MDGLVFGLIDNGVLAICAVMGIDIEKRWQGSGINGALYGALIGNTISDALGSLIDFGFETTANIVLGCVIIIPIVYVYNRITQR